MDQPFMARAIQLSIENVHSDRGGPFGAVIVKNGSIIAEGTNQVTSTHDPTAHAEVIAIREACRKLSVFQLDRKSTRLNSSHQIISYAVFCLKKKKIKRNRKRGTRQRRRNR